ncbi:MAG: ATP-binding cassette domain-containing protein [Acholeplasmataceae bacterium]
MIKVTALNKYFNRRKRNEIHVLNDVSIDFPDKGLVVLLGASGSGKTTLLNVIGGLDKVQSGTIDIHGHAIEHYKSNVWDNIRNDSIGYIFQNYNLLPELSVYDNIAFVLKMIGITDQQAIDERVIYVLKAVGMYPFRKKKALQLSGGQQQRVAIARALVKNPDIIIADEPTGNLDSKNTVDVMNIIKSISKDKLVVLVTHEKDSAYFYGDRIIEIKDGQIVNDYLNEEMSDHVISRDETIYLKDLKAVSSHQDQAVDVAYYSDDNEEEQKVSVRLIVKNKTLYIDVDSDFKKVKFADASSGVIIKDEHYQKKTRAELIQTTFDLDILDHTGIEKDKRSMISIKRTLRLAFEKILRTSRKGKLMLFSFLIAGMVIAVTMGLLSAAVILEPEAYMDISRGYVRVETNTSTKPTYESLMDYAEDDDSLRVHPYGRSSLEFTYPTGDLSGSTIFGQIELNDRVNQRDLSHGRLPTNPFEILISSKMAETIVQGQQGQDFGIWHIEQLFYETLVVRHLSFKIVGVVDSELTLIYVTEDVASFLTIGEFAISDALVDPEVITYGALPSQGEVAISLAEYEGMFGAAPTGDFPKNIPMGVEVLSISGVYEDISLDNIIIINRDDVTEQTYDLVSSFYVFTNDREALSEYFDDRNIRHIDVYQQAYDYAKEQQNLVLISTITSSSVLIGFAALGFYFVIRSSLISRIYEVSVYRALGVKKGDIFRSFLVEIFVLTTISTLIGYVLASIALMRLQDGLLGDFNFFKVTPLTFAAGILLSYTINVLAGLFPVVLLLQKTPAQILSQYDI